MTRRATAAAPPGPQVMEQFTRLDDMDIQMAIKNWCYHPDAVLSTISQCLLHRRLFKIRLQSLPVSAREVQQKQEALLQSGCFTTEHLPYLVFTGMASNTTYKTTDERIQILFKSGQVKDISEVDHALIQQSLAATVAKPYLCWLLPQ